MFKTFTTAALAVSFAGAAMAEENLTSAQFLTSGATAQRNFIANAAVTAGLIAAQNKNGQMECISAWFAANEKTGFKPILEAMQKMPNYVPNAVILAVFQKECGAFKYTTTASVSP